MKAKQIFLSLLFICGVLSSCDRNHQSEFNRIQRDDMHQTRKVDTKNFLKC